MSRRRGRGTGRGRSRFPAMLARRSNHLLAVSVAALLASVLGVQLGRSAIGEINPVHFRGPASRPQGIDPNALPPSGDAFAQAEIRTQNQAPPPYECGEDCDSYRARRAMVVALAETSPGRRAPKPYWRDATPTTEPASWTPGETGRRPLSVDRYMHYPIEEASAETAPADSAADDKPAADEDSSEE